MDIVTYALLNGKIKDYASNVDEWLEENVDPATGYVLDRSLQMENAAAPADMVGDINGEVGNLKNTLNNVITATTTTDTESETIDLTSSLAYTTGFITADGTISTSSNYEYTEKIPVLEGDIFNNLRTNYRFICAYDSNDHVVTSAGSDTPTDTYTVPNGISYIVLSIEVGYTSRPNCVRKTRSVTTYTSIDALPIKQLGSNVYGKELGKQKGSMTENTKWILESNSIRKTNTMRFYGKFSVFDAIILGHGESGNHTEQFKVDDTYIYFGEGGIFGNGIAHNLTIDVYICITITVDANCIATYNLETLGGSYSRTIQAPSYYLGNNGNIFVQSSGSQFTFAEFTWNADYQKNKWAFGDSYLTNYSNQRWPYYTQLWGYDNFLINAHPGENSASSYSDWQAALMHGIPKYVMWCIGMNDPDGIDAINASWKSTVESFLSDCEKYGITPILATIPTVPDYNHEYKNAYVRASGYRYIDFADAVGSDDGSGVWYSGTLSVDGVHPTAEGAKLLACRALSDFPEIMQT